MSQIEIRKDEDGTYRTVDTKYGTTYSRGLTLRQAEKDAKILRGMVGE